MLAIVLAPAALFFNNRNARAGCEPAYGGGEIDMLVIHYEAKNTPADAAAEAVKGLPRRVDVERRRLLLMKRTERAKVRAGTLEGKIGADYLHDVVRGRDLLNDVGRDGSHGAMFFLVTTAERCQINAAPSGLQMILLCCAVRPVA